MQVSILEGVYGDTAANFVTSYPVNMQPVIGENGLSHGYLRHEPGIDILVEGPGVDRGAIKWNGFCHRVMGSTLVRVTPPTLVTIGSVGAGGPVSLDYSFDRLAIASGGGLYYWDGSTLAQVTDPDLGTVVDMIWVDGYFMCTDQINIVVTDLNDPFSVNPLKYGSSESDPDLIYALKKVRGEVYVLNQYTIENLQNVGGNDFPFSRNSGGLIPKGTCGTHANAYYLDTFAFVGSGRNEAMSVYLAGQGTAEPLSTPQIDRELGALSPEQQAAIEMEARVEQDEQRLLIHLPSKTLVYSRQASLKNGSPVWHILASGALADQIYLGRHFVYAQNEWLCGSSVLPLVGVLNEATETQFTADTGWKFDTTLLYNGGKGAIIKSLELVGLPGRGSVGIDPVAFLSITQDGQTWGQERVVSLGALGQRLKRMQWRPKTRFGNYAGLRFRGADKSLASFARLEADLEPLNA